jgi:tetratricopeptide (TPR) repeat protein
LVILLHDRDPDRAIAVYEAAIRVDPNHAEMYCGLGQCLMGRGRFAEALVVLRKGHELGRQRPGWALPSEQWVQEAERMSALEARLPHVLAGEVASPEDLVRLADTCLRHKNRYADAALLYGKAFAADPSLTREPGGPRYHAACAAALAARGKGVGAEALASSERARLRALAFEWLRAEYIGYGELPAGDPAAAEQVLNRLQHWLGDPDLSAVRDPVELAKLPDDERDRWTKLWAAVQKLRARAAKE